MDSTTPKASFSNANRHMQEEEELQLTSVGVDIGSSTSHLVFSRLELTLEGSRYRVTRREVLNESDILLTPYVDDTRIDVEALGAFINQQYKDAKIRREEVDTGALILTGVAVRRRNARAIGELLAQEAGKFVAVSAGDGLEATMAAHGSGAVARSVRNGETVLNVDVGGGTSKLALCAEGKVREVTAVDIGARLVALNGNGVVTRIEEAGRRHAGAAGIKLELRRSWGAAGGGNQKPGEGVGHPGGRARGPYPGHGDRRVAVHHSGERKHDFHRSHGGGAGAQRSRGGSRSTA